MTGDIIGFENGVKISYKYDFDKTINGSDVKKVTDFHLYDRIRGFYQNSTDIELMMITGFVEKIENNAIKALNIQFKFGSFKAISEFDGNDDKYREYANDIMQLINKIGPQKCINSGIIFPLTNGNQPFAAKMELFNMDISVKEECHFEVKQVREHNLLVLESDKAVINITQYIPLIEKSIISSYETAKL